MADTPTKQSAKSVAASAKQKADDLARDVADSTEAKVKSEAEGARDAAASEVENVANAADAAANEFDPNSMQARAIEEVASRIDDLASQIRSTDIDRAARMVGDAARRNPLMFVAGAALAGFAATRFLKARDPYRRDSYGDGPDPWAASDTGTALHYGEHAYREGGGRYGGEMRDDYPKRGTV